MPTRPLAERRRRPAVGLLLVVCVLTASARQPPSDPPAEDTVSANGQGVTCRTVQVRMRDGVLLATDVYLPARPGRYPVILQRTPYGLRLGHGCFTGVSGAMAFWAEHGYVGVNQDVRGTFRSEGSFTPIFQEQDDGYDTVEWAAAQPWSNGRVAMSGTSYFGVTQWQAALTAPPHLAAFAPGQTASDYHDNWTYQNGVFDLWFGQSWILHFFAPDAYRRQLIATGMSPGEALAASDRYLADKRAEIPHWVSKVPLADLPEFRTLAPYYYDWLAHPNYDDYWARVDVEAHVGRVTAPALVSGAWGDLFAVGSVRSFEGMRTKAATTAARDGTMLVMESAGHGGAGLVTYRGGAQRGDNDTTLRDLQLRFYDRHVKGIDNGIDREPRVRLFVQVPPDSGTQGSGFWVTGDTFPLPGTEKVIFNLRSGGRANTRFGDGTLDRGQPSAGPDDSFVFDPASPVPSHGGGLCCLSLGFYFNSGAQDQSLLELRDDVLVYTSAPLEADLAVIGPVRVKFWATTTAPDTDFVAKLVDVHPSGFAQNILERVLRARFRHGSKNPPVPVVPGRATEYELELGYTATVFKVGHRIRLDITSSKFPHLARNPNTGGDPSTEARFSVATQTIHHGPGRPSYLELSVVPHVRMARP
jgi:putative CocE/NonD family hydrolase